MVPLLKYLVKSTSISRWRVGDRLKKDFKPWDKWYMDCVCVPFRGWMGKTKDVKCLWMGNDIRSNLFKSIKFIYEAILTSADVTKCSTETQPKTPNSKQCRCRSMVARENSLERPEPRKKPREEPWGVVSPLLAVPGGDYNRTWPRCSNVHRWPAGSNNNNHRGCRWCKRSAPQ